MDVFIYLDQNTLSDLRLRKIKETCDEELDVIRNILSTDNIHLVYSHVHLKEILQITVEQYRYEHIEVLDELRALYIKPMTIEFDHRCASELWADFLENEKQNELIGIDKTIKANELTSRKLSGLPINNSFEELGNNLKETLHELFDNCEQNIKAIDLAGLDEVSRKQFEFLSSQMTSLRAQCNEMKTINIEGDQPLGPRPFREWGKLRELGVLDLPSNEVISKIDALFQAENSDYKWTDYFKNNPQNNIARAYSLMNWAGYYADDFNKVKKGKDRFNASNNDMLHATMAYGFHFLISKDAAFCMKARACYEYIGANAVVINPHDFVVNYCTNV
jgi:hypothetical protein